MGQKQYLLSITEKNTYLYDGEGKEISNFSHSTQPSISHLDTCLNPKDPVTLLIDRQDKDIRELDVTHLSLWDLIGILFHKIAFWIRQGGYGNIQLIRDPPFTYLRSAHILQDDPLYCLITWARKRGGQIFFLPLEAHRFLAHQGKPLTPYAMVLHSFLSEQTKRQLVFKGKHLLLSRALHQTEDGSTSLHFLSRTFSDIYENVQKTILPSSEFLEFLHQQKKSVFSLKKANVSKEAFLFWGAMGLFGVSLFGTSFEGCQGSLFYSKSQSLLSSIHSLHRLSLRRRQDLEHAHDRHFLKSLEAYYSLSPHHKNPLNDLKKIASIVSVAELSLASLKWEHGAHTTVTLTFFLETLSQIKTFEALCETLQKRVLPGKIQVIHPPLYRDPEALLSDGQDNMPCTPSLRVNLP